MNAITFGACVRDTWTHGGKFIQRRPLTVAVAFVALLACNAAPIGLSHAHNPMTPVGASRLMQLIITLVRLAVTVALPMQVMQQIMLGDDESHSRPVFGRDFWRYLGLTTAIGMGGVAIAVLLIGGGFLLAHTLRVHVVGIWFQWAVWGTIALCLVTFVGVRLSLLFCHVAIGRTIRWRASWNDTRGHVWRILVSHLLVAVPLYACMIGIILVARAWFWPMGQEALAYLFAAGLSLFTSAGLVVGAACACWLYQRLARTLVEDA
jgi:hypothetical protein